MTQVAVMLGQSESYDGRYQGDRPTSNRHRDGVECAYPLLVYLEQSPELFFLRPLRVASWHRPMISAAARLSNGRRQARRVLGTSRLDTPLFSTPAAVSSRRNR